MTGLSRNNQQLPMAVPHWVLTPVLFLLPILAHISAQQQGCSVANSKPTVYENNPRGIVVTTIQVEPGFTAVLDPASPDGRFFTLQGLELQLSQSVDYEAEAALLVYLLCQNTAGQSDFLEIIVTILNVNDNSPEFPPTPLTRVVPEDAAVNRSITAREELSARDADLDTLFYELSATGQEADGYFAIKGVNNPEIYLQKALNYERFNSTTLVLYARDRPVGSNDTTHTATATINIIVDQVDSRPPWFLPCTFVNTEKSICISSPYTARVNISELPTGPLLLEPGPLYAVDPDYTLNERIVYRIVGGDSDQVFSVDADTGNLTMNKAVTSPGSYLLQVMATQVNNIQKYSIASVEIKVINKSDYAPHFESRIYNGMVPVGLAPRSFVFQAGDPSAPLMITAVDDDFPNKVNPNIEYSIANSTDFIATRDGLILTNTVLLSPGAVTIKAVAEDKVSLQKASTVIVVEVTHDTAVTCSDKIHTIEDMGILGGTLAALLLIALVFLGVMICKPYRKAVKGLRRQKLSKEISGGYQNQLYKQDEHPDVTPNHYETTADVSVQSLPGMQQQPALPLPSSHAGETDSLPKPSAASTITSDHEEKAEGVGKEAEHEKEVKSILKTERQVAGDGYKAVWFKTDVDPDAGERIEVMEDNAADSGDDSDQELQKNEEEEEDADKDSHHRGLGVSFAPESSAVPAAEVVVCMSHTGAVTEDDSELQWD